LKSTATQYGANYSTIAKGIHSPSTVRECVD